MEAGIMFTDKTRFLLSHNSSVDLFAYTGTDEKSPNPEKMVSIEKETEKEVLTSDLSMPDSRFYSL